MDNPVEVIKEGEIVRVPEAQAIEEDLFILRKVIEPEPERVSDFMTKPAFMTRPSKIEAIKPVQSYSSLESWKAGKFSYKRNRVIDDLVDNFHWEIIRGRRNKGLARKQLADAIGVPEESLKTIEMGELPSDDFVLINKIESYLGISLRKEKKKDELTLSDLQKMDEKRVQEEIEKVHMKQDEEAEADEEKAEDISGSDIEVLEDSEEK